jgi:hypothetical protein
MDCDEGKLLAAFLALVTGVMAVAAWAMLRG